MASKKNWSWGLVASLAIGCSDGTEADSASAATPSSAAPVGADLTAAGGGAAGGTAADAPDPIGAGGLENGGGGSANGGAAPNAPDQGGNTSAGGSISAEGGSNNAGGDANNGTGDPVACIGPDGDCTEWVKATVLHEADFEAPALDGWRSELESPGDSVVEVREGKLHIDVGGGATVWFTEPLAGDVSIEYEITVADQGGANDRVSDLNLFWRASDPGNTDLFTRSGTFTTYDNLLLYYAGIGGNRNSTTRFRKYPGDGTRAVIQEHLDAPHLLQGNTTYQVQVLCLGDRTQLLRDGEVFFDYQDPDPIARGNFAFRTVRSHQIIDNFVVHALVSLVP